MSKTTKSNLEHEVTFLIKSLPENFSKFPSKDIKQGYFSGGNDALRIRQSGDKFELTKKIQISPNDFSKFEEITIQIKPEEFKVLWPQVISSTEKTRFLFPLGKLTIEIDVFKAKMSGLIIAEVEFPDQKSFEEFEKPQWFGRDVTQDRWVAGIFLAGKSFGDIKKFMQEK